MKTEILKANAAGLKHRKTGDYWSFYTPVLTVAYKLGIAGVDLQDAPEITAFRYGAAPESFLSYNYAENRPENGLSVYTDKSIVRSEFLGREKYEYTGLVSGKGGDGETLILCYDAVNLD